MNRSLNAVVLVVGLSLTAFPALSQNSSSYQYNAFGQLMSATNTVNSQSRLTTYEYDNADNRKRIISTGGSGSQPMAVRGGGTQARAAATAGVASSQPGVLTAAQARILAACMASTPTAPSKDCVP